MFRCLALASAVVLVAGYHVQAADTQPKDVIARAIKAHGGEELLTKYKATTSKGKGKITLPGVGEVDITSESANMLPNKVKESMEIVVMGMNIRILLLAIGETYSLEVGSMNIKLNDTQKEDLKETGYRLQLGKLVPLLKDKKYELSLIGDEMVEGKPTVGIRVASKGHNDVSLYFDKKTNLLAKMECRVHDDTGNEISEERMITEYRKNNDGVPIPKKVLVKRDGKQFLDMEITETTFLEKLDDSEFKK